MDKIKDTVKKVLPGHHGEHKQHELQHAEPGTTIGTAGYGVVGAHPTSTTHDVMGATGQPTSTAGTHTTTEKEAAVCGQEYFTKLEDRPQVVEQKTYTKEHKPVEKEFVVETKATGREREMQGPVEHLGTEERIVAEAPPKAACE